MHLVWYQTNTSSLLLHFKPLNKRHCLHIFKPQQLQTSIRWRYSWLDLETASRSTHHALYFASYRQMRNEAIYQTHACLLYFVPRALNNSKHVPLKQHAHRFGHYTDPNEGMEERLGGQAFAPWGRAARIRSPPQPQPDRSIACCVLLMHSTASSLRNRHTTWSKCTCARACLQYQEPWLQRIEEALLPTYFNSYQLWKK